jgi:ribosomal protein S18 acetylase RimI-like enzyme
MDAKILPLTNQDINEIVDIHMRAFPDFFLTFLGPGLLKEFYKSFLYDDQGIGFVAIENGRILGVIVGPFKPAGYFKRLLLRKWYAFCFASIGAVLGKPKVIKRLFRAVFYRGEAPQGKDRSLLSSIAVDPQVQGQGVGKSLVERWVEEVRRQGSKGCYLTTDAENNEKINTFYQKLGWQIEYRYTTPEGRIMNCYVLDFPERKENT